MTEVKEKPEFATRSDSQKPGPGVSMRLKLIGAFCVLFFLADFAYTKHPHIKMEGWVAINAILGLIGVCVIVFVAKFAANLLARFEDDYDV